MVNKLFATAFILLCLCSLSFAADKEEKYEVTIEIVYNSVPAKEALQIQEKVTSQFKNTCKTIVKTKKVDQSQIDNVVFIDSLRRGEVITFGSTN